MLVGGARALLRSVADTAKRETGRSAVLVGYSGGKDSLIVLDLCKQVFDHVEAFFMYLVADLECVECRLRDAERRFQIAIHRLPHFSLSRLLKYGVCSWHRNGAAHHVREATYADVEALARKRSGIEWVALGQRASDSIERNAMLRKIGGRDDKACRVYPIWTWKPKDVTAYLRGRRLPIPKPILAGRHNDGVSLAPAALRALRDQWPDDYRRVLEVFPFAEAMIKRDDFQEERAREQAHQVSEVPDGALGPRADPERALQPAGD